MRFTAFIFIDVLVTIGKAVTAPLWGPVWLLREALKPFTKE